MAILIESTPGITKDVRVTFSDNHNVYTFSDNDKSVAATTVEFAFVVEVHVNGVLYSTHEVAPEITFNDGANKAWGKFDVNEILQTAIAINTRTTTIATEAANVPVFIKVSAKGVDNTGAIFTVAQVTAPTTLALKGRLNNIDFVEFLYNNKYDTTKMEVANGWQFYTNFPRTEKYFIGLVEHEAYLMAGHQSASFGDIVIKLYTAAGALIATATKTVAITDAILINAAPKRIVLETAITDANFTTCAYYTVQLKELTANTLSEEFVFWVDRDCSVYDDVRVYFLEKTGTIGAFTFRMLNRKTTTIQSAATHKQRWGTWVNQNFVFDMQRGEEVGIVTTATEGLLLNSDWITEGVQNWLAENMYESPFIIIERGGVYERATVATVGYESKQTVNDKLFNEVVELRLSAHKQSILA